MLVDVIHAFDRQRWEDAVRASLSVEQKVPAGKIIQVILGKYGTHKHPE